MNLTFSLPAFRFGLQSLGGSGENNKFGLLLGNPRRKRAFQRGKGKVLRVPRCHDRQFDLSEIPRGQRSPRIVWDVSKGPSKHHGHRPP